MTFTPADVLLWIAAVGVVAVNVITAINSGRAAKISQEVSAKADVIANHVNSSASASVAKIEALTAEVASLTKSLADEKMIAERLAQRAAPVKRK